MWWFSYRYKLSSTQTWGTRESGVAECDARQGLAPNISPDTPAEAGVMSRTDLARHETLGGELRKPGQPMLPGSGGKDMGGQSPHPPGYGLGRENRGKFQRSLGPPYGEPSWSDRAPLAG